MSSQTPYLDTYGMIQAVKGNSEERHEEQAPLFVCCSGCQAVLKAGCKVICMSIARIVCYRW